jgi:hypothetical protein
LAMRCTKVFYIINYRYKFSSLWMKGFIHNYLNINLFQATIGSEYKNPIEALSRKQDFCVGIFS